MKTFLSQDVSAGEGKTTDVERALILIIRDKMLIFKDEIRELIDNCGYQLENIDNIKIEIRLNNIQKEV